MITLTIAEIAETARAFEQLPPEMVKEATNLISGVANQATFQLKGQYPMGGLRDHVQVEQLNKSSAYAGFRIKNTDKKAWWWEYGTAVRHTKLGYNRGEWKRPHGTLVDQLQKSRAQMWVLLRDFLVRKGLKVSG